MSDTNAEMRQQRRDLRGTLLRAARNLFGREPDTISFDGLHRAAGKSDWGATPVLEEVKFLVGMLYLEKVERRADALDNPTIVYRITPRGMSLLNGDFADGSIGL